MYWKIIMYGFVGLLCLALVVGVGIKLVQKSEGYKANDDQVFYSFDYHPFLGGCARYDAFRKSDIEESKVRVKKEIPPKVIKKPEVKK